MSDPVMSDLMHHFCPKHKLTWSSTTWEKCPHCREEAAEAAVEALKDRNRALQERAAKDLKELNDYFERLNAQYEEYYRSSCSRFRCVLYTAVIVYLVLEFWV